MFFEIFRSQKQKGVIPIKRDFLEIARNNILQEKTVITIVKISSTELTKNFVPPSFLTPSPQRLIAGYRDMSARVYIRKH